MYSGEVSYRLVTGGRKTSITAYKKLKIAGKNWTGSGSRKQ